MKRSRKGRNARMSPTLDVKNLQIKEYVFNYFDQGYKGQRPLRPNSNYHLLSSEEPTSKAASSTALFEEDPKLEVRDCVGMESDPQRQTIDQEFILHSKPGLPVDLPTNSKTSRKSKNSKGTRKSE